MRRVLALAYIVLALTGLLVGPDAGALVRASSPAASSPAAKKAIPRRNATFGVQPASAEEPDDRGYFSIAATTGARVSDHLAVRNYSFSPVKLTLATSDAVNTPSGDFGLLPSDQPSSDLGTWISLPRRFKKVTVPARGFVIVPFEIVIPRDATPGDHAGGLTATLASFAKTTSGQRYRLLQTVGSRVIVRVSGPMRPALVLKDVHARYRGSLNPVGTGRTLVTYTIRNAGNVALGGDQHLRISGLLGLSSSPHPVPRLNVLLPGYSVSRSVVVDGVIPQVWMNAEVSVSPLVLPGTVVRLPDAYARSVHFWAVPWMLFVLIGFVLLAVWWRRRRRRRSPPRRGREREQLAPRPSPNGSGTKKKIEVGAAKRDEPVVVATGRLGTSTEDGDGRRAPGDDR